MGSSVTDIVNGVVEMWNIRPGTLTAPLNVTVDSGATSGVAGAAESAVADFLANSFGLWASWLTGVAGNMCENEDASGVPAADAQFISLDTVGAMLGINLESAGASGVASFEGGSGTGFEIAFVCSFDNAYGNNVFFTITGGAGGGVGPFKVGAPVTGGSGGGLGTCACKPVPERAPACVCSVHVCACACLSLLCMCVLCAQMLVYLFCAWEHCH